MITASFIFVLGFQAPAAVTARSADTELGIWEQIAQLESRLREMVSDTDTRFNVFNSDPVRGYYIDRSGVMLMIPIRYEHNLGKAHLLPPKSEESVPLPSIDDSQETVTSLTIRRKLNQWRAEIQKAEQQKDADFERLVAELKEHIPEMIGSLKDLARGENLILVIEERMPPWFFSGLSTKSQPTRKVATLTVDTELISQIHAHETEVPNDLLSGIKRTTIDRKLATIP